jgi:hypothetical protein
MHTVNYLRHLHSVIHLVNLWPKNEGIIYNKMHAISSAFTQRHFMKFYILLTLHLVMILDKWPTWRTILFYAFISILYMFRATSCSSSGESIVSIEHLVYVTLCRWPFRVQVGKFLSDLHTKRSPTQSDVYQMLYWYNWFSWWWARGCLKHAENWNKHTEKSCASSWSFTKKRFLKFGTNP